MYGWSRHTAPSLPTPTTHVFPLRIRPRISLPDPTIPSNRTFSQSSHSFPLAVKRSQDPFSGFVRVNGPAHGSDHLLLPGVPEEHIAARGRLTIRAGSDASSRPTRMTNVSFRSTKEIACSGKDDFLRYAREQQVIASLPARMVSLPLAAICSTTNDFHITQDNRRFRSPSQGRLCASDRFIDPGAYRAHQEQRPIAAPTH
jgi:hypothetical protein